MKDIRLTEAMKHCCNFCDYQTCKYVKRGHAHKSRYDCPYCKKYLKSTNKIKRKQLNKITEE